MVIIELQSRLSFWNGPGLRLCHKSRPKLQWIIPTSVNELQSEYWSFFQYFRTSRRSLLVHVFDQFLWCFTEPVDLLRLAHILKKLLFWTDGEIYMGFDTPRRCIRSPGSFAFRFTFPKILKNMICLSDWPCFGTRLSSSQWHSQRSNCNRTCRFEMFLGRRLLTLFGKISALFLEQKLNYINVFKWFPIIFKWRDCCSSDKS